MSAKHSRAMLRDMLGADIDACKHVSVSKQFADNFDAVCTRYNLTAEEREEAKAAARRDLANAETCFASIAGEGE